MSDDDRPKKSWRELDRKRDQSSHRGGGSEERGPSSMRENSRAYRSYKSQLDQMWQGGALPEALQDKLPAGTGGSANKKKELLEALRGAVKSRDVFKALKAYREVFGFPQDEDALAKLVDLDDDAVVLEALQTIDALHQEGRLKRSTSFKARLKTVKMTCDSPEVLSLAERLLQSL